MLKFSFNFFNVPFLPVVHYVMGIIISGLIYSETLFLQCSQSLYKILICVIKFSCCHIQNSFCMCVLFYFHALMVYNLSFIFIVMHILKKWLLNKVANVCTCHWTWSMKYYIKLICFQTIGRKLIEVKLYGRLWKLSGKKIVTVSVASRIWYPIHVINNTRYFFQPL